MCYRVRFVDCGSCCHLMLSITERVVFWTTLTLPYTHTCTYTAQSRPTFEIKSRKRTKNNFFRSSVASRLSVEQFSRRSSRLVCGGCACVSACLPSVFSSPAPGTARNQGSNLFSPVFFFIGLFYWKSCLIYLGRKRVDGTWRAFQHAHIYTQPVGSRWSSLSLLWRSTSPTNWSVGRLFLLMRHIPLHVLHSISVCEFILKWNSIFFVFSVCGFFQLNSLLFRKNNSETFHGKFRLSQRKKSNCAKFVRFFV